MNWRPVIGGFILQFYFATLILKWDIGYKTFSFIGEEARKFLAYTDVGSRFVFGDKFTDHIFVMQVCVNIFSLSLSLSLSLFSFLSHHAHQNMYLDVPYFFSWKFWALWLTCPSYEGAGYLSLLYLVLRGEKNRGNPNVPQHTNCSSIKRQFVQAWPN